MSTKERMQKKAPKQKVKLDITLNAEQKQAVSLINSNKISFLDGKAGSGKTLTGLYAALDALHACEINKIIVSRPYVAAKEEMGFLPGDQKEKMDPFMQPIYDNLKKIYSHKNGKTGVSAIDTYLDKEEIQIAPVGYLRGRTFDNAYVVVDECQNLSTDQLLLILTRLGKNSKLIFTGDIAQCDLRSIKYSGVNLLMRLINSGRIDNMAYSKLLINHRDPIVQAILEVVEDFDKEREFVKCA